MTDKLNIVKNHELPLKISIVIPTYNRQYEIKECIESLINQNFPVDNFEIIVVDSSSNDFVKKIIDSYAKVSNPKILYLYQEKNGPSAARNFGIKHATGEIVCFIDDDCIVDKDCIRQVYNSYTSEKIGGTEGKILGYYSSSVIQKYGDYLFRRTNQTKENLLPDKDGPITCNASYRRKILYQVNGFDPQFKTMEDLEIALRVNNLGYFFKFVPSAIVYHKHRTTLHELLNRAYYFSYTGVKLLCDKYPKSYSANKIILKYFIRIIYKIILYPYVIITIFSTDDKKFYLCKPFLDILVSVFRIWGLIAAVIRGYKYDADIKTG